MDTDEASDLRANYDLEERLPEFSARNIPVVERVEDGKNAWGAEVASEWGQTNSRDAHEKDAQAKTWRRKDKFAFF